MSNQYQKTLTIDDQNYQIFSLKKFNEEEILRLPITIRILLECALRKNSENSIPGILKWGQQQAIEIPFYPSRVLLQDYTGVPAVVDLASMREAVKLVNEKKIQEVNPQVPVELVIDHSIQVDSYAQQNSISINEEKEFLRNKERFQLLKWAQNSFENLKIVPPGSGIVHQINIESLARVVFVKEIQDQKFLFPDTLIGTDSHTTMVNGLGVLGWGVGGIEAEAVMLGESVTMILPKVVGINVTGKLQEGCCATDVVLRLTNILRKVGVVEKFVEFFGEGLSELSLADRATLSNMCPEYGATVSYFPVDERTLNYLKLTGRDQTHINLIQKYLQENLMFRNSETESKIQWTQQVELNLNEVVPVVAGPKRPQDMIPITDLKNNFLNSLTSPKGFNGFDLNNESLQKVVKGKDFELRNGSLLIAAITSCTNTSNPYVLISAGLLCKKACELGLKVPNYVKTSLSPGSKVVSEYLSNSGLISYMNQQGFNEVGYGCMTCIGNSGDLGEHVKTLVEENGDMVFCSALSGNRNFEGRVHPNTKANYLTSPVYVVAYALAGKIDIDFSQEPLGIVNDKKVFLKDIFPSNNEVQEIINKFVTTKIFVENYKNLLEGNEKWKSLEIQQSPLYTWDQQSTYIRNPPYFKDFDLNFNMKTKFENLHCLLLLGDTITTDHISPAGKISRVGPTSVYLKNKSILPKDFNSYGSRRGNHEVMMRGTFANIKIKNKMIEQEGPFTVIEKNGQSLYIFDACEKLGFDNMIVIAGKEYGTGSSRDWAGKGPHLLGVKVVIAESYERIHRSNLIGMGVLPLQFKQGDSGQKLGLTGYEKFNVLSEGMEIKGNLKVQTNTGIEFECLIRIDTENEMQYYKNGGILQYVLRKMLKE